jgi:hypothetical protein
LDLLEIRAEIAKVMFCGGNISLVRFFGGTEETEVYQFSVNPDARTIRT